MRRKSDDLRKFTFPMFWITLMLTTPVGASLALLKETTFGNLFNPYVGRWHIFFWRKTHISRPPHLR
jgi:hypothetical protein